ncbi:sensor histidine kinase [Kitasatospora sp. NPDC048365]|uniref:sensor histidine kinase n=1 Tax=Kitasatospora sp. NPDC048365 TaxID=3364050 RepID=UPI00372452C4
MGGRQRPENRAAVSGAAADGSPWTQADALVAVGAGLLDLLTYLLFSSVERHEEPGLAGFVLVVLSALPLLVRRRYPVAVLGAVVALGAVADLLAPPTSHFGAVPAVALFTVARTCAVPVTVAAGAATAVVTALAQSHVRVPGWQAAVSAPLTVLLVGGAGLAVSRWQREVAANRRLLADRAVADERRRIARELHDIVAHHITSMQLMAGGARANVGNPEVVRDALVTLESSGRMALREMRQLLDVLRAGDEPESAPPAPQPGVDDLDRLVAEACAAGLPTELGVEGRARPLPPTVGLTVFRIVQESLTNARRYAGPARALVRLAYEADRVTVEVRDDGGRDGAGGQAGDGGSPGREKLPAGSGYGLVGMRERVALHGGTLRTGPRPGGGWAVLAELPLSADEVAEAAVERGERVR